MNKMNKIRSMAAVASALMLSLAMAGCSNMTPREKNTAIGAGVGAAVARAAPSAVQRSVA